MSATISTIFPFILMLGLFYIIIFVPENRRKKKYAAMLNSLKINDELITKGGIIGRIVNIQDNFVIIQTGPDKMRIKLDKNGISNVLNSASDEAKSEEKKES